MSRGSSAYILSTLVLIILSFLQILYCHQFTKKGEIERTLLSEYISVLMTSANQQSVALVVFKFTRKSSICTARAIIAQSERCPEVLLWQYRSTYRSDTTSLK
jgi:hypothetical protein